MTSRVALLPYHLKHKSRAEATHGKGRFAFGDTQRGVVLKTYLPEEALRAAGGRSVQSFRGVTCDVLVYEGRNRTVLKHVPVMTGSAGLHDHEVWIPDDSTLDLDTHLLVVYNIAVLMSKITALSGDHVVIGFLNNDLNQPMIIGQHPHPKTTRAPSITDLTKFKYKRYLRGMSFGVTQDGNIEFDLSTPTTQPSAGGLDSIGNEVPTLLGGNFAATLQPGAWVSILDSTLSAPSEALLGTAFLTDYSSLLSAETTLIASIVSALSPLSTAVDPKVVTAAAAIVTALGTYASAQSPFAGQVTTALAPGLPYLSSHLKID